MADFNNAVGADRCWPRKAQSSPQPEGAGDRGLSRDGACPCRSGAPQASIRCTRFRSSPEGWGRSGYTIQRPTEDRFLMTREELENKWRCCSAGGRELIVFGISRRVHRTTSSRDRHRPLDGDTLRHVRQLGHVALEKDGTLVPEPRTRLPTAAVSAPTRTRPRQRSTKRSAELLMQRSSERSVFCENAAICWKERLGVSSRGRPWMRANSAS
jgi:hypothetical protein